jgi:diacylglycerol O-acyltransferase
VGEDSAVTVDRLSVADASLLELDRASAPLHMGGVALFAPGLAFGAVADTLRARLGALPLARKRVVAAPPGAGRPLWVDDADFDLSYHLRHAALPAPGDDAQLAEFVARLIARPLDRHRPLWELYVIEGLAGGGTALFHKVHLASAEGAEIFSALLTDDGVATEAGAPAPAPSALAVTLDATRERIDRVAAAGRQLCRLAGAPARLPTAALGAAGSVVSVAVRVARAAPPSPLDRRLSPHRRFALVSVDLDDLRAVRRAVGGTINDIVVAVTADAVGRLLRWRGHDTTDRDLRVMVPVRVRDGDGETAKPAGEGVIGVLAPLPVLELDPLARLYRVRGELSQRLQSRQTVAADALVRLAGYGPPQLHARAARLVSGEQRYNVAISNAPGPQSPRYLAGVRLVASYPFIPLAGTAALSVAVSSYAGALYFGLVGERDALPDLDRLAALIPTCVADLVAAASG